MKISVVMTTYNGEKFLIEQLDSIVKQSLHPDEVLIFDDCSTDNTVKIIRSYIKDNGLDNFKLFVNEKNLGWKKNFINGISHVTGDYIFTADQDDVWMLDKIEKMTQIIDANENINLLACNYELLNMRNERNLEERQLRSMQNTKLIQLVKFGYDFHIVMRPGCTYCFRRTYSEKIISNWREGFAHDRLLWLGALITKSLYIYEEPLIKFRRHSGNATGFSKLGESKKDRLELIDNNINVIESFCVQGTHALSHQERTILNDYIKYEKERRSLIYDKRIFRLLIHLIKNRMFVYSLKSVVKDLLISMKSV